MTDPALMRGPDWLRCCICGALHVAPYYDLYRDENGITWDVCLECHEAEARFGPKGRYDQDQINDLKREP